MMSLPGFRMSAPERKGLGSMVGSLALSTFVQWMNDWTFTVEVPIQHFPKGQLLILSLKHRPPGVKLHSPVPQAALLFLSIKLQKGKWVRFVPAQGRRKLPDTHQPDKQPTKRFSKGLLAQNNALGMWLLDTGRRKLKKAPHIISLTLATTPKWKSHCFPSGNLISD